MIFARPDLYYHPNVGAYLQEFVRRQLPWVLVPDWQAWQGFNDRLAFVQGAAAIRAYGLRADRIAEFCGLGHPLHSERFLRFAMGGCQVCQVPIHASRVRSTGGVVLEDFTPGPGRGGRYDLLPFADFERRMAAASLPGAERVA